MDDKARAKVLVPASAAHLAGLAAVLAAITDERQWGARLIEERVHAWLASSGLQIKDVAQPARVALTGRTASPGLFEVLEVLGREAALARLERGRKTAEGTAAP
jgi:glutamyl-tRNA synthetase